MKLRIEQLSAHLAKAMAPVYLIAGDEPLQVKEAGDAVRRRCTELGYTERYVFHAGKAFDWEDILRAGDTLSLFAEKRLIDVRLPTGKPGDAGAKVLMRYAEQPSPDTLLLITSAKVDARAKWVGALERTGILVQVWAPQPHELGGWIKRRMQAKGLRANSEVVALLAERVEGNLLAADQELEKLALLCVDGEVNEAAVATAVADSARFDVFGLVDSALAGDAVRVVRMAYGLRAEGVEPVLVLWALARELRLLLQLAQRCAQGEGVGAALGALRVWDSRKAVVGGALRRLSLEDLRTLLHRAARLDLIAKGGAAGKAWDELLQLALDLAGHGPALDSATLHAG
ncbi:MAG: hypothetical protein AMJ69_09120 [Gammaproteobacteria bacterium SG8_47]|nr:MAG: hypothetical protein AMJ69_09120 [Gammaproteobacteria bacterium SG8_47]